MRILIISDTHGRHGNLTEILEREPNIDLLIHLGDVEGGARYGRQIESWKAQCG